MTGPNLSDRDLQGLLDEGLGVGWTAAVALIRGPGGQELCACAGRPGPEHAAITRADTPFDLASLTKLFTASAALRLIARDELSLDTLAAQFGFPFPRVTVRHLLTHTSGLPASARLHRSSYPPDIIWEDLYHRQPEAPPGSRLLYSDVNYIVLGRILELATGANLTAILSTEVLEPLDLRSISFGPRPDATATEFDPWRGRRLRGEVHDESAAVLGGIAGHAGLFGSAPDLMRLIRTYSVAGPYLPDHLRRSAVTEQAHMGDARWGLGWKMRSKALDAPEGTFASTAFGHTGFTGTSIWHDPSRDLSVCLLTNRVYFGRDPSRICRVRRAIHEWAVSWSDANGSSQ